MERRSSVIILNGVGSVGKSTMARALQEIAKNTFLHVEMDSFLGMLPKKIFGHPDGLIFERTDDGGEPCTAIRSGAAVARAMRGMRHAIAAMAAQGNDLIVDEVLLDETDATDYRDLLASFDLRLVGLFAPLHVLEARERDRGDREPGLARWQFHRVHRGISYDLEIDTAVAGPAEGARMIQAAFGL